MQLDKLKKALQEANGTKDIIIGSDDITYVTISLLHKTITFHTDVPDYVHHSLDSIIDGFFQAFHIQTYTITVHYTNNTYPKDIMFNFTNEEDILMIIPHIVDTFYRRHDLSYKLN